MAENRGHSAPVRWLLAVHWRLLPDRPEVGWTPYLWLGYLSFFLLPYRQGLPGPTEGAAAVLSVLVFLFLYFNGYWRMGSELIVTQVALSILALAWLPFNPSSLVFFIYAAGFAGMLESPKAGFRALLALSAVILLASWGLGLKGFWLAITLGVSWIVGATNIYFGELTRKRAALRRSQEEVERLATLAERERIARDLHDLLGHTLSVITMKAELARKLSERGDGDRAAVEIADVERISRDALRQVREAVEGYREAGLPGELSRARIACEAREIALDAHLEQLDLSTRAEAALSMVLREAVTNVVRHSGAEHCRIRLEAEGDRALLTVGDDGRGGQTSGAERGLRGSGLLGMEERLSELGGSLRIVGDDGWTIEARLPLDSARKMSEPVKDEAGERAGGSVRLAGEGRA